MTRGATPRYADKPYPQWIRRHLERLGWQKQDLAARVKDLSDGRLREAGADRLVLRATHGENISVANRALIAAALGVPAEEDDGEQSLHDRLQQVEEELAKERRRFDRFVRATTARLAALEEAQEPPAQISDRRRKGGSAR